MSDDKINAVGTNIAEKATMIRNVAQTSDPKIFSENIFPKYFSDQAASSYTARTVAYSDMPAARIEITHWDSLHLFDGITFDDGTYGFSDICSAATRDNHKIGMG